MKCFVLFLTASLLGLTAVALADDDSVRFPHDVARAASARGEILPLSAILAISRRSFPAVLIEVEFERENGRYIYELVLLTSDGAVLEAYYDATTGRLLKIEYEDNDDHRPDYNRGAD